MLDYYILWLQQRVNSNTLKTYWVDGVPQVEVNFRFKIPGDWTRFGYDEVWYSGTIDRVCIDDDGMLWGVDYKTAAAIQMLHYLTDPQINAYMWALPHIYDKPIAGFIYQQHLKDVPKPGRILKQPAGAVSLDRNQRTTRLMYRETLIQQYGEVEKAPPANIEFLNWLATQEDENSDRFVRRDKIYRNERRAMAEGQKILLELEDMLNPNLPLYPNPTRDCATFCFLHSPCTTLDDGGNWQYELELISEEKEPEYDYWRKKIIWPGQTDSDMSYFDDIRSEMV